MTRGSPQNSKSVERNTHLPGAERHDTSAVTIGALLHLLHKLGQLGVGPTAVVDLGRAEEGSSGAEKTSSLLQVFWLQGTRYRHASSRVIYIIDLVGLISIALQ